jgi:uncharacterized protein YjbI with pentapeptide repeats
MASLKEFKESLKGYRKLEKKSFNKDSVIEKDMTLCNLKAGKFNNLAFDNVNFDLSMMHTCKFLKCHAHSLTFYNAKMFGSHFKFTSMKDCDFAGATMTNNIFSHVTFRNCNFKGVDLKSSFFDYCTFIDCDFTGVSFHGVKFSKCQSNSVDLLAINQTIFFRKFKDVKPI